MPWPKGVPRTRIQRDRISASLTTTYLEGRRVPGNTPEQRAAHTAYMKKWQGCHPAKVAAWKLRGQQRVRVNLIEALGGTCVWCGFDDWRALQVDHVNGDGRKDPHRYGSRYAYAKIVLASPDRYQLLCANCNWIKRYESGEHNHRRTGTED